MDATLIIDALRIREEPITVQDENFLQFGQSALLRVRLAFEMNVISSMGDLLRRF
jgi:hypothetical protein